VYCKGENVKNPTTVCARVTISFALDLSDSIKRITYRRSRTLGAGTSLKVVVMMTEITSSDFPIGEELHSRLPCVCTT